MPFSGIKEPSIPGSTFSILQSPSRHKLADSSALDADRKALRGCLRSPTPSTIRGMPNVLVCPPDYFDVVDIKNPHMLQGSYVDRAKARTQWEKLCSVMQQNGCQIHVIDPVPGLEDMVFAANQVFVGEKAGYGKFVVPSRMRHPSRHREVPYFTQWFAARNFRVIDLALSEDDHLEGHGDLLWDYEGSRIYAGYGFRSTRGAIDKFSVAMSAMGIPVIPLELIDPYCYHLDTCLCALNAEAALIFAGAFSAESLAVLHKHWKRIHLLDAEEAHHFRGNGIVVNAHYIAPGMTPQLETILRHEGLTPEIVDTSEFEKSGGSCFCMTTFFP
jgi:N-dimethylarginine dimethylaminohydrolase